MKKILIIIFTISLLSGCTVSKKNLETTLNTKVNEQITELEIPSHNEYRNNYSFYLPHNAAVEERYLSNDIIKVNQHRMYLFVDLYAYKNELNISYILNSEAVYHNTFEYDENKFDIIIYDQGDNYTIFASNDYARISTNAKVGYVPDIVESMVTILSSLSVDDKIVLNDPTFEEAIYKEVIDIFKSKVNPENIITQSEETEE